jgi:hypothetical protein
MYTKCLFIDGKIIENGSTMMNWTDSNLLQMAATWKSIFIFHDFHQSHGYKTALKNRKLSTRTNPEQCPYDVTPLQLTAAAAIASKSGFLRMPKVPGVCALFARPCGANVAVRLTSEAQLDLQKNRS